MHYLKILAVLFTLVFGTLFQQISRACECSNTPTVQEDFKRADLVFSGKVLRVSADYPYGENEVTFQVDRVWKGDVTRTVTFNMANNDSCMTATYPNGVYLVYAFWVKRGYTGPNFNRRDKNWLRQRLDTTICGRTNTLKNNPDLAILGSGYAPSPNTTPNTTWAKYLIFSLLNLALLKAGMIMLNRRKRQQ